MGLIRLLIRLPLLLLHLLFGTPATVLSHYRPFRRIRVRGVGLSDIMLRWWGRTACRIFGVDVRSKGRFSPGPQLVVANHISWLDTEVLHSLSPMGFVAKAEIKRWLVAGYLAHVGGSVFHERGSHDSAAGVISRAAQRLQSGGKVAIFAEGGILPGFGVKRFHARLFAAAIETGTPVQPVMIRYVRDGAHYKEISFGPGEGFLANTLRLLTQPQRTADVHILDEIPPQGRSRRGLATRAETAVKAAFESPIPNV